MNQDRFKFRAWDGKKMHYDYLVARPQACDLVQIATDSEYIKKIYCLDSWILMQCTGLKDINSNLIWEGDILRTPSKDKWEEENYSCFEVFFHDGDANFDYNIGFSMNRMHNHGSVAGGYIPSFKPKVISKMIIIGNIYENPELIK